MALPSCSFDTNGERREIEMRTYVQRPDETWALVLELDDVGIPGMVAVEMPGYAYGRTQPSGTVTISYRNEMRSVRADSLAWWAFFDRSASDTDQGWDWPLRNGSTSASRARPHLPRLVPRPVVRRARLLGSAWP